MTTKTMMSTDTATKLALEVFLTWTAEPNEYEYDVFGLRKACGNACAILQAVEYSEERSKLLDQMHNIWGEARDLDKAFGELALRACALREQALEALKVKA